MVHRDIVFVSSQCYNKRDSVVSLLKHPSLSIPAIQHHPFLAFECKVLSKIESKGMATINSHKYRIGRKKRRMMVRQDVVLENRVIVFTDVHNYSIAAQTLGDVHYDFLQEMYETLGEIIVVHGGEIIKYLGDGIICVFPDGAENDAVRCALELRAAFSDLVALRSLPPDTELEIGIHSGPVAIGMFGHASLLQKDILGDAVMWASAIGHHRGVAITERIYERVKVDYETRKLPEFRVKWRPEPLPVWEVVE